MSLLSIGNNSDGRYFDLHRYKKSTGGLTLHLQDGRVVDVEEPPTPPKDYDREIKKLKLKIAKAKEQIPLSKSAIQEHLANHQYQKAEIRGKILKRNEGDVRFFENELKQVKAQEIEALKTEIVSGNKRIEKLKTEISETQKSIKAAEATLNEKAGKK